MIQKISLPFSLPVNLRVTQYRGSSPGHSGGIGIDLEPIIDKTETAKAVAQYVGTYSQLFGHLRYGLLRINKSKTCWHYHFVADAQLYESGYEQYAKGVKIDSQGKPVTACVSFGDVYTINHRKYGAATPKFTAMIGQVTEYLLDVGFFTSIVSLNYWKEFYYRIKTYQSEGTATVFYDTRMISERELESILSAFSQDYEQTFISAALPGSPKDQDEAKAIIIAAAILAGGLFVSSLIRKSG